VQEYPLFENQFQRFRQGDLFRVPSRLNHRRRRISVIHRDRALSDDRTGIEIVRHDMRRSADDLHAALVGLMIRLGADERRQNE